MHTRKRIVAATLLGLGLAMTGPALLLWRAGGPVQMLTLPGGRQVRAEAVSCFDLQVQMAIETMAAGGQGLRLWDRAGAGPVGRVTPSDARQRRFAPSADAGPRSFAGLYHDRCAGPLPAPRAAAGRKIAWR